MAKLLSVALIVLLGWFIYANARDIVAKIKAKRAEKKEKECDKAEHQEKEGE